MCVSDSSAASNGHRRIRFYCTPATLGRGRDGETRLVFAQTAASKYLLVVVAEGLDGRDFIVTAPRHDRQREARVPREGTLTTMSRLDELREHYDTTDMAAPLQTATRQEQVADEILVSTSIRLPKPLLDRVRACGRGRGPGNHAHAPVDP
jgi:hypothetical protein